MASRPSSQLQASLDYLTDAAHLLRTTAPQTSAQLMRQRADVALHNNVALHPDEQQLVCSACGHILVPGLSGSSLQLRSRHAVARTGARRSGRRDARSRPLPAEAPSKLLRCGRCHRQTTIRLAAPEPARRSKTTTPPRPRPATAKTETRPSANASSKRRAKSRKAGLQALLSARPRQPSSGLTLADFAGKPSRST